MNIYKLLKRFLKDPNIVGFSLVEKKVYVKAPATIPNEFGTVEVIGEPRPFFLQPRGCSPDFETQSGSYLTAQHCIGINNDSRPITMMDGSTANIIKANPWQPLTTWGLIECIIEYFFTRRWKCINVDWALIDRGNAFPASSPVGALSGGTEPPGLSFFAPYVDNPNEWVGKQICGISYDYDNNVYVQNTWNINDFAVVRYNIDGNIYPVFVWYAKGFSKPGFSGTNAFPPSSCPQIQVKTIEASDSLIKDKA
ncbi:MAG: hypothetical protein JHC26_12645 [Thermofilum sp.]|jgi:hypothetical protein|uniref:hypothetical protein n=1 Tax=Thermofilum sp. TaxID=1961369 RepID=UPI002586F4EA|nr:hypothetical protein [Thermofilum sp.]MCI4409934.1 hypothetical protein [Thermofilum sp.]